MASGYARYSGLGSSGGGSGTVTSVAFADGSSTPIFTITGSPITTSGTITETLATQNANTVFAGPASGAAAQPTFRSLVAADVSGLFGNLTDAGTDGIVITNGLGVVLGAGTSIAQHVADATHNGYLSSADWSTFNGKQASGNYITALTGDVTASGPGSVAATLATVNGNVGTFGSSTAIPNFTVNGKGLITAASTNAVIAPAGTLTGTTLNSTVVSSSLTSVGTIATGVWNGTAIDATHGGTAQTTWALGDTLYASAANTLSKLPGNTTTTNKFLAQTGTGAASAAPSWQALVAGDIPNLDASKITTGTLAVARGGTNLGSYTANSLLFASAAGVIGQVVTSASTVAKALTTSGSGAPSYSIELDNGPYNPTVAGVTNATSQSGAGFMYTRVGNTIAVWGQVTVAATATANCQVSITLPVAITGTFASRNLASGSASVGETSGTVMAGDIYAYVSHAAVLLDFAAPTTTAHVFGVSFAYQFQ